VSVLLRIEGLDLVDGVRWAVRELDLEIEEGTAFALLGGAAAGKTLLLRAIAGLHPRKAGRIRFAGRPLEGEDPALAMTCGIALAAQRPRLFGQQTVRENLLLGAAGRTRADQRLALAWVLALVPELAAQPSRRAFHLNLPERHMVELGRALMARPRLLLLDEPLALLPPERIERLLEALSREGVAVLLAERLVSPALRLVERGCLLQGGRIVLRGDPVTLFEDPRVHAACLGEVEGA
jgi:branched-chain amino acid transport system ATP-binding protein